MAFELNRIDGTTAVHLLSPEHAAVREDQATIELGLATGPGVELYLPASDGVIESHWFMLATDLLLHLTAIDNLVQRACAEDWRTSDMTLPSSYYEGELAYITLSDPDAAVLGYFVIGCNSNWEERFVREGGRWVRVEAMKER